MTANKPMTGEQLDELMTVAVNMQRDAEIDCNRPSAMFAYAVQVAVLELRKIRDDAAALAAENAVLKAAAVFATAPDMWEELGGNVMRYQYQEWYADRLKSAMETPATDAIIAEVRAQGVEMFARSLRGEKEIVKACTFMSVQQFEEFAVRAEEVAAQLRKGVQS